MLQQHFRNRRSVLHRTFGPVMESIEPRLMFNAVADFINGNGNTLPDQYPGVAGAGWATAWSANTASSHFSSGPTVKKTSPLDYNGNYLTSTLQMDAAGGTGAVSRAYTTSGNVNTGGIHEIGFDFRFDSALPGNFASAGDAITIFGDNSAKAGTNPSNTWAILAYGAVVNGVPARHFAFQSGTSLIYTGIELCQPQVEMSGISPKLKCPVHALAF